MSDEDKARLIALVERGDLFGVILELTRIHGGKLTAEQVKSIVRLYGDQEFPGGWECGEVSLRVGEIGEMKEESLLVLPTHLPPSPPTAI